MDSCVFCCDLMDSYTYFTNFVVLIVIFVDFHDLPVDFCGLGGSHCGYQIILLREPVTSKKITTVAFLELFSKGLLGVMPQYYSDVNNLHSRRLGSVSPVQM